MNIVWHDEATLYGIKVKAFFFDAEAVNQEGDFVRRNLPFLTMSPPQLLFSEIDKRNLTTGRIIAQPDAVLTHGSGLICLEFKSNSGRPHSRQGWQLQVRLSAMLQSLIMGYVTAQNWRKVTACVLRCHNVCYLLTPSPAVMRTVLEMVPMAIEYYKPNNPYVSASQLAKFVEPKISSEFKGPDDPRSQAGKDAHEHMLRPNQPATASDGGSASGE